MKDLLKSQIKEQCTLNMPDGLKELMSDISREVLRAQPSNIYRFIAGYLSAMLVTRDHISITAQVCSHLCQCDCKATLLSELQQLGLEEADLEVACDVIMKYFNKGKVGEGNLISVLMKKTEIEPSKFPEVLNAVRAAYLRQQALNITEYETTSMSGDEEIENARAHTLKFYCQSKPTQDMYHAAADKIKASYRAYGVRREMHSKYDYAVPQERTNTLDSDQIDDIGFNSMDSLSEDLRNELEITTSMLRNRMSTVSSLSLAGSFCSLPKCKPYNANDVDYLSELEESSEKEHSNFDYSTGILEQSSTEMDTMAKDANDVKNVTLNDQVIDTDDGKKLFEDFADELIDESVTIISNKSDNIHEVIEEYLHEGNDQGSLNNIPDEELNSEGLDYDDDYDIIDDECNDLEEYKDDMDNDSSSESNDVFTEVLIHSNLYDSNDPTSLARS